MFRSVEPVAALVAEVFSEFGIPTAVESAVPLGRSPVLQALIGLVRLEAGDWQFRQLLAVLNNNYFQPNWPEWQDSQAARPSSGRFGNRRWPRDREKLFDALSGDQNRSTAARPPMAIPMMKTIVDNNKKNEIDSAWHWLLRRLGNALAAKEATHVVGLDRNSGRRRRSIRFVV